jgi:hypothetical protein
MVTAIPAETSRGDSAMTTEGKNLMNGQDLSCLLSVLFTVHSLVDGKCL